MLHQRATLGSPFLFLLEVTAGFDYYRFITQRGAVMLIYKVIELATVTEETIEDTLNEWTASGWRFDTIQFAMRESSRRPSMAFVIFTRKHTDEVTGA